MDVNSN